MGLVILCARTTLGIGESDQLFPEALDRRRSLEGEAVSCYGRRAEMLLGNSANALGCYNAVLIFMAMRNFRWMKRYINEIIDRFT